MFLTTFSGGPKTAIERTEKYQLNQISGAGLSKLQVCRYFHQFFHDTVSKEESEGNIHIEFAQRASPTLESEVVEAEGNGNVLVEKEVRPPQKKRKVESYRKPMSGISK